MVRRRNDEGRGNSWMRWDSPYLLKVLREDVEMVERELALCEGVTGAAPL